MKNYQTPLWNLCCFFLSLNKGPHNLPEMALKWKKNIQCIDSKVLNISTGYICFLILSDIRHCCDYSLQNVSALELFIYLSLSYHFLLFALVWKMQMKFFLQKFCFSHLLEDREQPMKIMANKSSKLTIINLGWWRIDSDFDLVVSQYIHMYSKAIKTWQRCMGCCSIRRIRSAWICRQVHRWSKVH